MHNNLDDEMKVHLKQEDSKKKKKKEKKEKCDNLHDNDKEQLQKYKKKRKKTLFDSMCFCTTDFKKIKTTLPRSCDEEYFISLASKR